MFGNVVLADQGLLFAGVPLPAPCPSRRCSAPPNLAGDRCAPAAPCRFRCATARNSGQPGDTGGAAAVGGQPGDAGSCLAGSEWLRQSPDANGYISLMVGADAAISLAAILRRLLRRRTAATRELRSAGCLPRAGSDCRWSMLETFTDLSVTRPGPGNAVTQLTAQSEFVHVPSAYAPPAIGPTAFPAGPTRWRTAAPRIWWTRRRLPISSLSRRITATWPPLFGVLAQGNRQKPSDFNLLVVYDPPSGGSGVTVAGGRRAVQQCVARAT